MVLRSGDQPRTMTERVSAAATQLEELAKAQGRGSQALRNEVGHILQLNPSSALPLLTPTVDGDTTVDSALKFQNGSLRVRNASDTADRDLAARGVSASGDITAPGRTIGSLYGTFDTVYAGGAVVMNGAGVDSPSYKSGGSILDSGGIAVPTVYAGGTVTINGAGISSPGGGFGGVDVNSGGISTHGRNINTDPGATIFSAVFQGGIHYGVFAANSAREMKRRVRRLDGSALEAVKRVQWDQQWEYLPDRVRTVDEPAPPATFTGPMVDDLDADPVFTAAIREDPDGNRTAWDVQSVVGVLGAALAELGNAVEKRDREISHLSEQIEALTRQVSNLQGAQP